MAEQYLCNNFVFVAILRNEASWFDQNNSMALSTCLSADAPLVRSVLVDRVITLLQNMGLIVTAFVIAIKLQWKIALVIISTFPAMIASYAGQVKTTSTYELSVSQNIGIHLTFPLGTDAINQGVWWRLEQDLHESQYGGRGSCQQH